MLYDPCSVQYMILTGQREMLQSLGLEECTCCGEWVPVVRSRRRGRVSCVE